MSARELVVCGIALTPFSPDQIASLNAYQGSGGAKVFRCGTDAFRHPLLIAEREGWFCLDCSFTQNYAYAYQADWTWRDGVRRAA